MLSFVILADSARRAATWTWPAVPCTVLHSKVADTSDSSGSYVLDVRYTYKINGLDYESDLYTRFGNKLRYYDDARSVAERYREDCICYVSRDNPRLAVLKRSSFWMAFFAIIPLIFVFVGGGGIYAMFFPISLPAEKKASPRSRRLAQLTAGALLSLLGGAILYGVFWKTYAHNLDAQSWPALECTVLKSGVRETTSEDSTEYAVDILYSYQVGGLEYRSDNYNFWRVYSSGYAAKRQIADSHPIGSKFSCYVNPRDSHDAVVDRAPSMLLWIALLPLAALIAGLALIRRGMRASPEMN
jgi:hypothetical protein